MLDNHMVHGADKELDKKGSCPNCGRLMVLLDWCEDIKEKCGFCKGDDNAPDCLNRVDKNYCKYCDIVVDID